MIQKIRISLWDILTFFISGFLVFVIYTWIALVCGQFNIESIRCFLKWMPLSVLFFLLPISFTLMGMLLEPVANYFDQKFSQPLFEKLIGEKEKHKENEEILENFIKLECLGKLNGQIKNPFHICKEYVETKQLSTTFMVFLSRYGFYRNVSFLSLIIAISALIIYDCSKKGLIISAIALILAIIFKTRSQDFYSYQKPAVYRAFLIDKINWQPAEGPKTEGSSETE